MENNSFSIIKKIYYHDTDAGGVVYYARYLEFFEEGRTEFLASRGIDTVALKNEGILFVVAHVEADYRKPAFYLDEVKISTAVEQLTASSIHFRQMIKRDSDLLVEAKVVTVCVGEEMKPRRLPSSVREAI